MRDLGFLGNSEAYTRILYENYISPSKLDPISKEFIKKLKRLLNLINQSKVVISIELFYEG